MSVQPLKILCFNFFNSIEFKDYDEVVQLLDYMSEIPTKLLREFAESQFRNLEDNQFKTFGLVNMLIKTGNSKSFIK